MLLHHIWLQVQAKIQCTPSCHTQIALKIEGFGGPTFLLGLGYRFRFTLVKHWSNEAET
jgi:hypothetical protein